MSGIAADVGRPNMPGVPRAHPAPWIGVEESEPLGPECDDSDCPFVIRDAEGAVVLTLWEKYGAEMQPLHVVLGQRIIAAVNASEARA